MLKHPTAQTKILALPPGRHYFGHGLCLVVTAGKRGTKPRWIFRYTSPFTKKVTETSIGSALAWNYSAARGEASRLQYQIDKGEDPMQAKREQRIAQTTFTEVCDQWIANQQSTWSEGQKRNAELLLKKHGSMLLTKAVSNIDANIVEEAIKPLWTKAPKQARRTLAIWARVFAYAKKKGMRTGDNPAAWRDNLDQVFPKQAKSVKHHASMPYQELPEFIRRLGIRQARSTAAVALEFLILTATRSEETLGSQWSEFDLENRVWTIPASRMKTKEKEHRVPLCERAIELLAHQREYSKGNEYVFSGYNRAQLVQMALRVLLRNMDVPFTVHGFRATFKSWATEQTNYSWELIELCLSHKVGTAVAQAYLRSDALEKRREIMDHWAEYCTGGAQ